MRNGSINTALIKVGTDVITTPEGLPITKVFESLGQQVVKTKRYIPRTAVVTSGAVASGRLKYGEVKHDDETLVRKQVYATAGQGILSDEWSKPLDAEGHVANMMFLTRRAIDSRIGYRGIREVLEETFRMKKPSVPIINENDTESTEELRLTDNDQLAFYVANMIKAKKVILLTSVEGILKDLDDPMSLIQTVPFGSRDWMQYMRKQASTNGRGGMPNKCRIAAKLASRGIETIIAMGRKEDVITRILLDEEPIGTRFLAADAYRRTGF